MHHGDGVDTLPPDETIDTPGPGVRPLAAGWDRYEVLELLGKGGMGAVYRARDRRLGRTVAIKLIRDASPQLTMRMLHEARAQARIDHPGVCRIYEVGEVEGRAYIALQLVAGEPLHRAAAQMSLEEKISVMRDVAVAVQEAHRLGIVHRDLKPANILVERNADGRWLPIVMDFGLAREMTLEVEITQSGALLGTPAYMSPEQARGDTHAIDRRSDVYSLGATLYELLTGHPPFPATSLAQALTQVLHHEPAPPHTVAPSLPVDLETIVLKCLAKDPAQRYPSARALADDLGRHLDGEPILGRRPSLWQRLQRRARRQRAVFVLGAWSLAAVVALAVLGARAWLISRAERARTVERTLLADQLAREANAMEASLRSAYQAPLHDTRAERERVRRRMRDVASTAHDLGEIGDALRHHALGRGHLVLHDWREAADELAMAAAGGLDSAELHMARGRALGELYHRGLEDARRSGDRQWLAGRQRELARQYLTPALAEIARQPPAEASGLDASDSAALVAALLALYRRDFATAEQLAQRAAEHAPSLFEAHQIAAAAAYGAAVEAFDHGNYDAALPGLDRATAHYAQASDIARSDPSLYEAAAQAWLQRAEIEYRRGGTPREPLDHALEAIDRALRADPDNAPAYTTKAYVLLRWYRTPRLRGSDDQGPLLDRIAGAAERATRIDPGDAGAWDALGIAHLYRGLHDSEHGGQGVAAWKRALDALGEALRIRPDDPWANNDLGVVHRWLGTSQGDAGGDPTSEYREALSRYERAVQIDPDYVIAWSNQADLHVLLAGYHADNGIDPQREIEEARRAGDRCLAIDPSYYMVLDTLAQAELLLADHLMDRGGDPTEPIARARGHLDRADKVQPGNMVTWLYRAVADRIEARLRQRQGLDPWGSVASGRAALAEALRVAPGSADCYVEAARLDLVEAAGAVRERGGPAAALDRALADAEHAIALDSGFAEAEVTAASACLRIATLQPSRKAALQRGMAHVKRALELDPRLHEARAVEVGLLQRGAADPASAAPSPPVGTHH